MWITISGSCQFLYYVCVTLFIYWFMIKPQLAIAKLQLHASMMSICLSICLSVCLSVCCQNAKKTLLDLYKSKWIRHLENLHDVIFFCRGWSGLDKRSQTGTEWQWHVDCGDVWKWKPDVEYGGVFGRIQWHVIPEPRITLQGAATWWIHCHDSRATCHIAECSHLTKSMSWSCHCRL